MAWSEVKKEMVEEKGLDPAAADKIGEYVKHKGKLNFTSLENALLNGSQAARSCSTACAQTRL